jgi:hypothetical protein
VASRVVLSSIELVIIIIISSSSSSSSSISISISIIIIMRDGVTIGWGKLYNDELHDLCSSPNAIGMI